MALYWLKMLFAGRIFGRVHFIWGGSLLSEGVLRFKNSLGFCV